jgi:hypothetical protein
MPDKPAPAQPAAPKDAGTPCTPNNPAANMGPQWWPPMG